MNGTELPPAFMARASDIVAELSSTMNTLTPTSVLQFASPWHLFDKAWMTIFGYHAQDFQFEPGETPLSTFKETVTMLVVYYSVVLGGREWMRARPAFKLNTFFLIHNFYLTLISGFFFKNRKQVSINSRYLVR